MSARKKGQGKPYIVIHVNGGVVDYTEKDVDVFFFDWDNLEHAEDLETLDNAIGEAEAMPDNIKTVTDKKDTIERLRNLRAELVDRNKFIKDGHL